MREIRLHGSEGGGIETNRSFPPLFFPCPFGAENKQRNSREREQQSGTIEIGPRVARIDPNRLVKVGNGLAEAALRFPGLAALAMDCGLLRVQPQRHVIVDDRLGMFALALPCTAALEVGSSRERVEPDRLAEVGDRLGESWFFAAWANPRPM